MPDSPEARIEELSRMLEDERTRSEQFRQAAMLAESNELQLYRQFFPHVLGQANNLASELQQTKDRLRVMISELDSLHASAEANTETDSEANTEEESDDS